jgi:ATP-binding cassette subfamily B protein
LRDLSVTIAPGERVALVAGSGAGKSTIAALLARLISPSAGCILANGVDISLLALHDVRRTICVVEQMPFVFSGTLLDNLRYGTWDAAPETIEAAVVLTELTDVIRAAPLGLASVLEEEGRNLSVGQRQRIALARAIVRAPAVVVLDEATSGLDGDTEARIFAGLESWLGGRTLLVISHRLATVARFDRILVLADGRLVGDGSLPDLMQTSPAFAQLFADQLGATQRSLAHGTRAPHERGVRLSGSL